MTSDDEFQAQMKAFEEEFRQSLPQKIKDIDEVWAQLRNGGVTREAVYALLVKLHSLAGSGRTFGVSGLSEAAAAAESAVEPWHRGEVLPRPADLPPLEPLIQAVRDAASQQR